jgi:hypothetical protein
MRRLLEALGPAASVVIDAQDFQRIAADPIGDNKRRLRDNEFARSRDPSGMTKVRILRMKMLNAIEDVERDAFGGGRIIRRNVDT